MLESTAEERDDRYYEIWMERTIRFVSRYSRGVISRVWSYIRFRKPVLASVMGNIILTGHEFISIIYTCNRRYV
jgi:hypothetical protein